MKLSAIHQAADKVRRELSKTVNITIKLTQGNLHILRRRYREQHETCRTKYPKLVGELTDDLLVKYAVYEINNQQIQEEFSKLVKKA